MNADQIITVARSAIGTPFKHQGRIAGRALDCAGLVLYVCKELGIAHTDVQAYGHQPHAGLLESHLDSQESLVRIEISEMSAGDIFLMKFTGDPQHVGFCAGDTIIHSYAAARKVCEHDLTGEWKRRIVRVYRFKEME